MTARTLVAGIGCRRQVSAEAIVALVRQALADVNVAGDSLATLAVPRFKQEEPAVRQAAAALGVALTLVDDADMAEAQARCMTRSDRAERTTGLASIAEGAALAAAGPGSELALPRIGNGTATCALARRHP